MSTPTPDESSPRPPSELALLAKAPKGSRYKGTYRTGLGWFLAVLWPFGLIQSIVKHDSIGSTIVTLIVWAAVAFWLIKWGRSLKAQKIVVIPKALRSTAPGRGAPELQRLIAQYGERGRISLYVMDRHLPAIEKLAATATNFKPGPLGGSGALVAWADIIPEPKNTYDSKAIQAHVMGRPVAYFSLEWKDRAHAQLRASHHRGAQVPVVVRWWNGKAFVWAFSTFEDAESFAKWAMNDAES